MQPWLVARRENASPPYPPIPPTENATREGARPSEHWNVSNMTGRTPHPGQVSVQVSSMRRTGPSVFVCVITCVLPCLESYHSMARAQQTNFKIGRPRVEPRARRTNGGKCNAGAAFSIEARACELAIVRRPSHARNIILSSLDECPRSSSASNDQRCSVLCVSLVSKCWVRLSFSRVPCSAAAHRERQAVDKQERTTRVHSAHHEQQQAWLCGED